VGLQQGTHRADFLTTPGLTHALVTPFLLGFLLDSLGKSQPRRDGLTLFVGAGVLSADHWRAARETITADVRTWVASTEVGAFCATAIETAEDLVWHRVHSAREAQVVNDDDQPLPPGRIGHLRVRPLGVEAYMDDPETSAGFFRHGYFYPGDLAVLREDGRLALWGRITDVINVLGDKRATLPIETLLQDRLGAAAVCVFSAPGAEGEAVHVAIQPGRLVTEEQLRAALDEALPGVPGVRLHAVKGFPRNAMGKIERATLRRELLERVT
jgi:acyl-coenzyme A synthetase/AMP-(fatty) acid ligase